MRLIDADKLLQFKTDHEMISTHQIWNAPTIEAIPIKFIRDTIKDYLYIALRATPKIAKNYQDNAKYLENLIKNWETFGK